MLRLLRNRNFSLLWLGGLISLMGDWALTVALPFEVYRRTGSTVATAGIVLAGVLPAFFLSSAAGVFVDRWNRRRLMVLVNIGLAITMLPLLAVDALGVWIVYVVLIAATVIEQAFIPAEVALLPRLVGEDQLVAANSMSSLNRNLARLLGPALGGAVVALGGLELVVIVDAGTFLAAAILIAMIPASAGATIKQPIEDAAHAARSAVGRVVEEWRDGLRHVWHNHSLRPLLAFSLITTFGEGVLGALFVPWVSDVLHADNSAFAAILSAQAVGGLVGAVVVGRFLKNVRPALLLGIGSIIFGFIDLAIFAYPLFTAIVPPAVVGMAVVGLPATAIGVGFVTLQQTLTKDSHRGRAIGLFGAVTALGVTTGTTVAGLAGNVVGILPMLVIQGTGYVIAGVMIYVTIGRRPMLHGGETEVEPLIEAPPGPQAGAPRTAT